jgi:hypothetical protein
MTLSQLSRMLTRTAPRLRYGGQRHAWCDGPRLRFYHAALGGCSGGRRTLQSGPPAATALGLVAGALSHRVR